MVSDELTAANGITLNGFKFMALQANDTEVIGRKGVSTLQLVRLRVGCPLSPVTLGPAGADPRVIEE